LKKYKVWKGFEEIKKPNKKKCGICGKVNSDWVMEDWKTPFSHNLCEYKWAQPMRGKSNHEIIPMEYSEWVSDPLNRDQISKAITKPNKKKCRICGKVNSERKGLGNYSVHKLCQYKMGHYGMNPKKYSKWKSEFIKIRPKVLERDNFICVTCKNNCENCIRDLKEKGKIILDIHHIIGVRKGGSNSLENLITVCRFCNRQLDRRVIDIRGSSVCF